MWEYPRSLEPGLFRLQTFKNATPEEKLNGEAQHVLNERVSRMRSHHLMHGTAPCAASPSLPDDLPILDPSDVRRGCPPSSHPPACERCPTPEDTLLTGRRWDRRTDGRFFRRRLAQKRDFPTGHLTRATHRVRAAHRVIFIDPMIP